ncbi:hypothetical protein [Dyadobacter psychrophilus]|nr:hypothetical protein [Dyadobacter psychrophilus]
MALERHTGASPETWPKYSSLEFARSLKMVHDLALYHSDVPFDTAEKSAHFDVKVLWEGFEKMGARV